MIHKTLAVLVLATGLTALPVYAETQTPTQTAQTPTQTAVPNWFDPMTWMTAAAPGAYGTQGQGATASTTPNPWMPMAGGQAGGVPQFNLATPGGWTVFMNPSTYAALMNPATYGQFMSPNFYMQFANPNNWMSWMNPAAYGPWMNPMTYAQWMNPLAYMAFMNPNTYMQWMNPGNYAAFMNPASYMQWMNPAAYDFSAVAGSGADPSGFNWFDPNSWMQMTQPQSQAQSPAESQ
jgi:hypothetical protein